MFALAFPTTEKTDQRPGAVGRRPHAFAMMIATGLVLTACAPAPPPYYPPYNVQPAYSPPDWGGPNYQQPVLQPPLPPPDPSYQPYVEFAPVKTPAPVAPVLETPVPPAPISSGGEVPPAPPPAANPPPPDKSPNTALPPLPPAPTPVEGSKEDDCVGWWRICHFL